MKNIITKISEKKICGQVFPFLTVKKADGSIFESTGKSHLTYEIGENVEIKKVAGGFARGIETIEKIK